MSVTFFLVRHALKEKAMGDVPITDYLANTFSENELNRFHPDFIAKQSELIPECSITKLMVDNGNYRIDSFASIEHLR